MLVIILLLISGVLTGLVIDVGEDTRSSGVALEDDALRCEGGRLGRLVHLLMVEMFPFVAGCGGCVRAGISGLFLVVTLVGETSPQFPAIQ